MKLADAKKEFEIRYYFWAKSEFEREISESFAGFRSFKSGAIWEAWQFMQLLDKSEQLTLAHSLLKKWRGDTIKMLGENVSDAEEFLLSKFSIFFQIREQHQISQRLKNSMDAGTARVVFQECVRPHVAKILGEPIPLDDEALESELDHVFRPIPTTFREKLAARKEAGEKVKFASKKKLRKAMVQKFKDAFEGQCVKIQCDPDYDPYFDIKCCGWIISTVFWFGRQESFICYHHSIESEARIQNPNYPEISVPAMKLEQLISFGSWLGITNQTQWEHLTDDEIEPACNDVINKCQQFFEVAPRLLKGLEFEKITAD